MKRLYKSRTNKVIDGVCGGIAEYLDLDPVLIRIIFVLMFFFGGSGILAYIIGMIIMPTGSSEKTDIKTKKKEIVADNSKKKPVPVSNGAGSLVIGLALILMGGVFLMRELPFMSDIYWFVKDHFWEYFIPIGFILLGLTLIFKGKR